MPRHPKAAATTEGLGRQVFDALTERARAHRGTLHRLNIGDTWREPPIAARRALAEATTRDDAFPPLHGYPPARGEPGLRRLIHARLARRASACGRPAVPEERILITAGATGALSTAAQALLDPGDEVLLPSPFWPLIRGLLHSRGATPVEVPVLHRLAEADLERELEDAVTDRTVALYLNTPSNPTGATLDDDRLAAVARVAARHDLWVLADEVYEDLWHEQAPPPAAWLRDDLAERTVSVHSTSKSHALAGCRVGWLHAPDAVFSKVSAVHVHQAYCAPKPMQRLAAAALENDESWLESVRADAREASQRAAVALGLSPPGAGTFLFFDAAPWLDGATDALPFLERCLDAGVLLTPGTVSGGDFATWVRLCVTALPPDVLDDALTRLRGVTG